MLIMRGWWWLALMSLGLHPSGSSTTTNQRMSVRTVGVGGDDDDANLPQQDLPPLVHSLLGLACPLSPSPLAHYVLKQRKIIFLFFIYLKSSFLFIYFAYFLFPLGQLKIFILQFFFL